MTSLTLEDQILKSDRRGRVRVPRAQREAWLAEFARSGVTAAEFARLARAALPTRRSAPAARRSAALDEFCQDMLTDPNGAR